MTDRVVAFDFDDVLFPFNQHYLLFHNQTFGTSHEYEDLFSYEMELVWKCDKATIVERVHQFYQSPYHELLEPFPEAKEAVTHIAKLHQLEIVTSRPEKVRTHTHALLSRHFPKTFRNVHFTNGFGRLAYRTADQVCGLQRNRSHRAH